MWTSKVSVYSKCKQMTCSKTLDFLVIYDLITCIYVYFWNWNNKKDLNSGCRWNSKSNLKQNRTLICQKFKNHQIHSPKFLLKFSHTMKHGSVRSEVKFHTQHKAKHKTRFWTRNTGGISAAERIRIKNCMWSSLPLTVIGRTRGGKGLI